jgi:RNA polymerase-binding transcription factor
MIQHSLEGQVSLCAGGSSQVENVYRGLWFELKRQRAKLLHDTIEELLQNCDATVLSDLLDQASIDQEQELSMLVKQRTRDKLRQIDIALERMEQRRYGLCLRCEQEIPLARLKVQPTASHCVTCLALDESRQLTATRR